MEANREQERKEMAARWDAQVLKTEVERKEREAKQIQERKEMEAARERQTRERGFMNLLKANPDNQKIVALGGILYGVCSQCYTFLFLESLKFTDVIFLNHYAAHVS